MTRLRLMMVLPHLEVGGAQRVAVNLANFWAQSGHDVTIVTLLERKTDYYDLDPRIGRVILVKRPAKGEIIPLTAETSILLRLSDRMAVTADTLEQRLLAFQPRPAAFALAKPASSSDLGRFRLATMEFIKAHASLDLLLRQPVRMVGKIWRSMAPSASVWRTANPRAHMFFVSLLTVRSASISTQSIAQVYALVRAKAKGTTKRIADRCLRTSLIRSSPRAMARLMRTSFWRVSALRQHLRRLEPDVVISFLSATNVMTVAAGQKLGCRIVVSERNDPARQELREPWQSLRPHLYPLADLVTANSHGALEQLQEYCHPSKLAYVANPVVAPEHVRPCERSKSILFLARLVHQKAPDILVKAFASFAADHPGWTLEIAGDGPMEAELRESVEELDIEESVTFHGMVKDPTELLHGSRIFALPSRFEGTPNSLLEAMTAGLACVVTDASPGPLRLVEHEISGLVVKTDDPAALADALARLADDEGLQVEVATAARERTREFLIDSVARQWETLLFPHDRSDQGEPSRA